ncbi:MAG TPA: hypothetical protein ENN17_10125 [bacterium]|nr:hypothetical protein [bacterium]
MNHPYRWKSSGCRILQTLLFFSLVPGTVRAQDATVISRERYVRIAPVYQSYASDTLADASQLGISMELYMPFGRQTAFLIKTGQARFETAGLPGLSGFGDTQLAMQYYLPDRYLLFQMTVNLPTGKQQLTIEEFRSSIALGHSYYDFRMPNMGQGLNLIPGVSWAGPLNENLMLGLGAACQISGSFQPLMNRDAKYNPGNEFLITGGADYRFSDIASLSADLIVSFYGTDEYDTARVYKSGTKIVASMQYQRYAGFNHLRILARYRSRTKSLSVIEGKLVEEAEKTYPDYLIVSGQYTLRMNPQTSLAVLLENRHFFNIAALKSLNLVGIGLTPMYQMGPRIALLGRLRYQTGAFRTGEKMSGIEVSAGIKYAF